MDGFKIEEYKKSLEKHTQLFFISVERNTKMNNKKLRYV